MRRRRTSQGAARRKGGVAVIFALLLPAFVGLIALSVDVALVATARGQMEAAADAGALAGARELFTNNHLVPGADMTSEVAAATSSATSRTSSERSTSTTLPPSAATLRATVRPMPCAAPVTTPVFPSNRWGWITGFAPMSPGGFRRWR